MPQRARREAEPVIRTYPALVQAFIDRRHALGLSQLELDERAGWPAGYAAKLEKFDGSEGRVAGATSLPLWFEVLGIELTPVYFEPVVRARPRLSVVDLHRRPRRGIA